MPKSDIQVKIMVNIRPGPATPAQKAAWHNFWQKIIPDVKADDLLENPKG